MKFKNILLLVSTMLILSVTSAKSTEECFENTSRAIFKFNMALDNAIIEPIAKGYNKLPEPIRNGASNFTSNIATLLSIPNALAQGNFKEAADASASFLINTTVGIVGLANPAEKLGLSSKKRTLVKP